MQREVGKQGKSKVAKGSGRTWSAMVKNLALSDEQALTVLRAGV